MYGQDILCGISKVPFEIPHKLSCPYIETCSLLRSEDLRAPRFMYELVIIFEMLPGGQVAV